MNILKLIKSWIWPTKGCPHDWRYSRVAVGVERRCDWCAIRQVMSWHSIGRTYHDDRLWETQLCLSCKDKKL